MSNKTSPEQNNQAQANPQPINNEENSSPYVIDTVAAIAAIEEKNRALNDQLLRSLAEMENTRKRAQKDAEDARQYAVAKFATDLISVMENLYRALESAPSGELDPAVKNWHDGILITQREMAAVFEKFSIKRHFPLNEIFDHNFHQAMSQAPAAEGVNSGTVLQVLQAGYSLHDRLLRPALVIVAG